MTAKQRIDQHGRRIILDELSKIEVSDIMINRSGVTMINQASDFMEIVEIVIQDGHSRFPVFSEKIDNIIGILYVKDLLQFFKTVEVRFEIRQILRKPLFVPENKKASELLTEFRESGTHMAIVVDEYGTMVGLISLEDILEEIVGDISDEYDRPEDMNDYQQIGPDEFMIYPKMPLERFNEIFKSRLVSKNYTTIGGLVLDEFGYVPTEGEKLSKGNLELVVRKVEGSRLREIIVKKG